MVIKWLEHNRTMSVALDALDLTLPMSPPTMSLLSCHSITLVFSSSSTGTCMRVTVVVAVCICLSVLAATYIIHASKQEIIESQIIWRSVSSDPTSNINYKPMLPLGSINDILGGQQITSMLRSTNHEHVRIYSVHCIRTCKYVCPLSFKWLCTDWSYNQLIGCPTDKTIIGLTEAPVHAQYM